MMYKELKAAILNWLLENETFGDWIIREII